MGKVDKFYEFSKIMWRKLNSKWSIKNKVIEQAVTNFLIYHDKMFNEFLIKSFNNNGSIMTIALTNDSNIKFDDENNVLNENGEIVALVHQYDRKKFIVTKIKKKFLNKKKIYKSKYNNKLFLRFNFPLFIIFVIIIWSLVLVIRHLFKKKIKKKKQIEKKKFKVKFKTKKNF